MELLDIQEQVVKIATLLNILISEAEKVVVIRKIRIVLNKIMKFTLKIQKKRYADLGPYIGPGLCRWALLLLGLEYCSFWISRRDKVNNLASMLQILILMMTSHFLATR